MSRPHVYNMCIFHSFFNLCNQMHRLASLLRLTGESTTQSTYSRFKSIFLTTSIKCKVDALIKRH